MSIRVLIADDQPIVRTGLTMLLDAQPDIEVVGAAADGREAVRLALQLRPDVGLFDIRMPLMDGIEATRRLAGPDVTDPLPIVVITTFDLDEYVHGALKAGARGFLLKDAGPALLTQAIHAAADGDALIAPSVTVRLLAAFAHAQTSPPRQPIEPLHRPRGGSPRACVVVQARDTLGKDTAMSELLVDFITSLDGYASGEGWPGFWGLEGPEYLAWLGEQPEATYLMGANTYRLMSGFAAGEVPKGQDEFRAEEEASVDELTQASKVVFSSSLEEPLTWANSTLVRDDAVEAVRAMKASGSGLLSTIGSLSLCRSLLRAGLVDRFRVGMFPVITGATGAERIYDGYPDVALEMIEHRTFDGRIQLVEYKPRVLEHPPLGAPA